MKYGAILVVLTSHGCTIQNLDRGASQSIKMETMQACEAQAEILDATRNLRALCINLNQTTE